MANAAFKHSGKIHLAAQLACVHATEAYRKSEDN